MRAIVTDVAWSVFLCLLVSARLSRAETAESIEMSFGMWTRVGPYRGVVLKKRSGGRLKQDVDKDFLNKI